VAVGQRLGGLTLKGVTERTTTGPALERIHVWRTRLTEQTVVSASEVQDRLFDLYGDLQPFPQLELLKPWLSLTIQREMFSAGELEAFLDELHHEIDDVDLAGPVDIHEIDVGSG
jgi:hypothetical protein